MLVLNLVLNGYSLKFYERRWSGKVKNGVLNLVLNGYSLKQVNCIKCPIYGTLSKVDTSYLRFYFKDTFSKMSLYEIHIFQLSVI